MNQKGFAPVALLIAVLVVAGVVGGPRIVTQVKQDIASIKLPLISNQLKKVPASESAKNITQQQVTVISKSESDDKSIKIAGKYNFGEDKKIEYEFRLPKNGGPVNGQFGGMCEGKITGSSENPNREGKAKLQGVLDGKCQMGPLPFKVSLGANFEGFADFINNNININYKVTQPISTQSNLVLPFSQEKQDTKILPPQPKPYKVTVTPSNINFSGRYEISDTGYVDYNLFVPRQAGTITGTASGDCNAAISGQVGEVDIKGIRQINGTIKVNCKPMVTLNNQTSFDGTFWGPLDDKKGEIEVIHNGIFQKDANGVFFLNYTP